MNAEPNDDTIYPPKWILDGCATLAECVIRLHEYIADLEELQTKGRELTAPVEDGYGWLTPKTKKRRPA